MRGMATALEWIQAAPAARYPIQIDAAEAGLSRKGESQIKISFSVSDGQFKGSSGFHHIGTDGGTKYGAMGKKHLRSLGVPVDSDAEIPDSVIAAKLQGLRLFAECGNEQREKKASDAPDAPLVPQFELDPKTGQKVAVMNLTIIGYVREAGARLDFGLPGQQLQPQGQPSFVPQGLPQHGGQGLPPGYVPQQQVQQVQQGYPPGYVPQPQQGFVPGQVPTGLPPGFAPPQPGYVAAAAPPVWTAGPNGVQGQPGVGVANQGLPPGMGVRPG